MHSNFLFYSVRVWLSDHEQRQIGGYQQGTQRAKLLLTVHLMLHVLSE